MKIINTMKKNVMNGFYNACTFFPCRKPTILFVSFEGQYNDNPKYISEEIHESGSKVKIYWGISSKKRDSVPQYVKCIKYNSIRYKILARRCQVLVDNVVGFRWEFASVKDKKARTKMTNPHQLNISTWHGTPIKRIGRHEYNLKDDIGFISCSDYLISGCIYTQERLAEAFYPIPVVKCGTPRNDILVNGLQNQEKIELKKKLGLPIDKKIILYAPTFRKSLDYSGFKQMVDFDIPRLLSLIEENVTFDEGIFVYRVHHTVLEKLKSINEDSIFRSNLIFDGNLHDDMAEYLAVSDVLISDYSGSIFDYALTQKPGFLYTPDEVNYINEERGVYISLDDLPYPHSNNIEEFYNLIREYSAEESLSRIDIFNNKVGNVENGNASKYLVERIINFLESGKK